jgi:hypothetical protein
MNKFLTLSLMLFILITSPGIAEDSNPLKEEMRQGLPTLIGKNVYAAGFSLQYQPLFEPGTSVEEMQDRGVIKHGDQLILVYLSPHLIPGSTIPLFEPLKIVVAEYVDSGAVVTLQLPNGKNAVTFVDDKHLEKQEMASPSCTRAPCQLVDMPLFDRVAGSYLTTVPKLSVREITAIKKDTRFPGMSKNALQYVRKPVLPPHTLSSYMRNVGLLYVETVEKAFKGYDDGTDYSVLDAAIQHHKLDQMWTKQQFDLIGEMDDRIKINVVGEGDKDFHEYGLKILRKLAERCKSHYEFAGSKILLARVTSEPGERAKLREEADNYSNLGKTEIAPYIRCNSELRALIESGVYQVQDLLRSCKY